MIRWRIRYMTDCGMRMVADRLPQSVMYWAVIRIVGTAWERAKTKTPDDLTFDELIGPWSK